MTILVIENSTNLCVVTFMQMSQQALRIGIVEVPSRVDVFLTTNDEDEF